MKRKDVLVFEVETSSVKEGGREGVKKERDVKERRREKGKERE